MSRINQQLLFNLSQQNMFTIILCLTTLLSFTRIACYRKHNDKLLLSPAELVDLVSEEQHKNKLPFTFKKYFTSNASSQYADSVREPHQEPEKQCEDEKTLKNRKLWSRWSKWGECSVSCGGGTTMRQRLCLAGRCAPGEREEQRRPCNRPACSTPHSNLTEEIHELD